MELPSLTVLNEQFAIRSVLGELGPFEATYLAWDLKHEEQVVIREYLPVLFVRRDALGIQVEPKSEKEQAFFDYGLQRYLQETVLIAQIDHPNVVRERGYFRENGTVYRVSDYHPGASLKNVLLQQGNKVSPKTAMAILMPLMDGIGAGHQHGLIHGGISPAKVYLSKTGRPMVLSYKTTMLLLAQRSNLLKAYQQPGYTPPEQYTPRGKHGPWSDVYGCAATLYSMLTGKVLPDIPTRVQGDTVPGLLEQAVEIPASLCLVLENALDLRMTHRPQTIDEFRDRLTGAFDILPPAERPEAYEKDPPAGIMPNPIEDLDDSLNYDDNFQSISFMPDPSDRGPVYANSPSAKHPAGKSSYRLDELDFVDDDSQGDGSYELETPYEPAELTKSALFQSATAAPARPSRSGVEVVEPKSSAWNKKYDYGGPPMPVPPKKGRRTPVIAALAGVFIVLSYMAFLRWQSQGDENYQVNSQSYENVLIRADSLYKLAKDVAAVSNMEKANEYYSNARELYYVAQTIKTDDDFVQQRIDEIDTILTQPLPRQLDEKESLALISRGDSLQRSADGMMVQGDSVRARALYMEARKLYLDVLEHRPDDSLASARLQLANQRIVTPFKPESRPVVPVVDRVIPAETQRQRLYEMFRAQGDSALAVRNLEEARRKFLEAFAHRPGDGYVNQQLQRISQLIAESTRNGLYRQHMSAGERLATAGRLAEARREYELALENKPNDPNAIRAMDRIDEQLEVQDRNEKDYVTERTRGDLFLEQKNYQAAVRSYQTALAKKPGDDYARSQIDEINLILSSLSEQEAGLPDGMVDENGIYNFTEDPPVLVGGRDVLQARLRYPALAMEARVEGRVSVRMVVDETGRMLNPTIIKGLGYGCDDEVLRVIRGARFEPARVGGVPVKTWHTLYFDFKLGDR